ncbi:MAG: YfbK domain-containing protein, partial [Pseudomonadota bacterium]
KVDAGEVGSGHSVTALYEIISPDSASRRVDPLRYGTEAPKQKVGTANGELAWLKMRYKLSGESKSGVTAQPISVNARTGFAEAPADARFATAVAGFGQLLRGNGAVENFAYQDVLEIANGARGKDSFGYRAEFTQLVRAAAGLAKVAAR